MVSFVKHNILTISCIAIMAIFGTADEAFATDDLMNIAQSKAVAVFRSVKSIIFVVGGFGLVALAFMAIFGKLDWKKFSMLAVGLAILAAAGAVVEYATGVNTMSTDLGDTFNSSARSAK